jgi:hypothetical protein
MAATVTWDIATLERKLEDGAVHTVHYIVTAKDQEVVTRAYGSVGLDPADPDSFVPYESLDKAIVIGWVKTKLSDEQVKTIETTLENEIKGRLSPNESTGVPW